MFAIFSAMRWLMNEHEPDLYDSRMRDWYIKAAASPKEIVILLDSSGTIGRNFIDRPPMSHPTIASNNASAVKNFFYFVKPL
jgi:hypothetical protein